MSQSHTKDTGVSTPVSFVPEEYLSEEYQKFKEHR